MRKECVSDLCRDYVYDFPVDSTRKGGARQSTSSKRWSIGTRRRTEIEQANAEAPLEHGEHGSEHAVANKEKESSVGLEEKQVDLPDAPVNENDLPDVDSEKRQVGTLEAADEGESRAIGSGGVQVDTPEAVKASENVAVRVGPPSVEESAFMEEEVSDHDGLGRDDADDDISANDRVSRTVGPRKGNDVFSRPSKENRRESVDSEGAYLTNLNAKAEHT